MLIAVSTAALIGCHSQSGGRGGQPGRPDGAVAVSLDRVVDGDTVDVVLDGQVTRVRVLGIDTPEAADPDDGVPAECGADAATEFVREITAGATLNLTLDPPVGSLDRFGRTLGYLDADEADVGLALVEAGLAEAWRPSGGPDPVRYQSYLHAAAKARADGAGSWGNCGSIGR